MVRQSGFFDVEERLRELPANARKSAVRSAVEHVFARQKGPMALVVRTIGIARARVKIGLANLAYNLWTPPAARCSGATAGVGCVNLSGLSMERCRSWP
jgi:hypothetical protein